MIVSPTRRQLAYRLTRFYIKLARATDKFGHVIDSWVAKLLPPETEPIHDTLPDSLIPVRTKMPARVQIVPANVRGFGSFVTVIRPGDSGPYVKRCAMTLDVACWKALGAPDLRLMADVLGVAVQDLREGVEQL